ncbi:MAG: hypothetical protein RL722_663 [Pseudomonadota bacterium]|jgi:hypothetical protein
MKRKLIVTLVASALELYAAAATAQVSAGSCVLPNGANSANFATEVRTGPLNPTNGFPEYVTDSNGLSVQRCLDPNFCFFDPIVPSSPFSLQIGSGGEAFYWDGSAVLSNAAGNRILTLVYAAETAFLEEGPDGGPVDGSQFPFLRMRFVMGVPVDGTYTVKHPYGINTFRVTGATGARDVAETVDHGFAPNSSVTGPVGPFLVPVRGTAGVPGGFVADGGGAGGRYQVTGSPCGFNRVELTGVDTAGRPVDFGTNEFIVATDSFSLQGMIYDGRVQTPLSPTRATYSRSAAGGGQIDTFATSSTEASVTVKDGPTVSPDASRIVDPLTLDHLAVIEGSINSLSLSVTDAAALPPVVSLTASAASTDVTTLNVHLVDFVDIAQADYDPATGILSVTAASSDLRGAPALTLRDFGSFAPGASSLSINLSAPPAVVHVDSAAGGSASAQVRMIQAMPPAAPSNLEFDAASSTTVTLRWVDQASNESGFKIYTVDAEGNRSQVGVAGGNARTATVTGLTASTAYTFQVDAYNAAGSARSNVVEASTLALPVAPVSVAAALASQQLTLDVSWIAGEDSTVTGYRVYRRIGTGAYALISGANPLPASQTSLTDAGRAANTSYTYQVVAVRGDDTSVATTSSTLTTPATPSSPTMLAPVIAGNKVTVRWTDRASNEWGYRVYRATVTGTTVGSYAAVSPLLDPITTPATGGTGSWDDNGVANGNYRYRVDVSNWAGTLQSATANAAVAVPVVPAAPTALNFTPGTAVGSVALNWTNVTNETGYTVERSLDDGATWSLQANTAANVVSTNVTGLPATGVTYRFRVTANNAVGSSAAIERVIPSLLAPTGLTITGTTVTWTDNSGVETGYMLQTCGNTCANTNPVWANVGALITSTTANRRGFNTTRTATRNTVVGRTYRMVPMWGTTAGTASDVAVRTQ